MLAPDPEMRSPGVGSARAKSQTSIITNEFADDSRTSSDRFATPVRHQWLAMWPSSHGGAAMTKHVKPTQLLESIVGRRELILEGLRDVSADAIGTALKAGKITAGEALVAAERVAPGMFDAAVLSESDAASFNDEILKSWEARK